MLSLQNVTVTYPNGVVALRPTSAVFEQGKFIVHFLDNRRLLLKDCRQRQQNVCWRSVLFAVRQSFDDRSILVFVSGRLRNLRNKNSIS
jgi:hypothetical protein